MAKGTLEEAHKNIATLEEVLLVLLKSFTADDLARFSKEWRIAEGEKKMSNSRGIRTSEPPDSFPELLEKLVNSPRIVNRGI